MAAVVWGSFASIGRPIVVLYLMLYIAGFWTATRGAVGMRGGQASSAFCPAAHMVKAVNAVELVCSTSYRIDDGCQTWPR